MSCFQFPQLERYEGVSIPFHTNHYYIYEHCKKELCFENGEYMHYFIIYMTKSKKLQERNLHLYRAPPMVALELGGVSVFMPRQKRAEEIFLGKFNGEGPQSIAMDTYCGFVTKFWTSQTMVRHPSKHVVSLVHVFFNYLNYMQAQCMCCLNWMQFYACFD